LINSLNKAKKTKQNAIKTTQQFDKMSHQAVKKAIKLTIINAKITITVVFLAF
jgi:hypothetical protein